MFIPDSKAMMQANRSFDGNRKMNAGMSRDIYGAFDDDIAVNGLGNFRLGRAARAVATAPSARFIGPSSSPRPIAVPFMRRKSTDGWSHAVRGDYRGMGEMPTAAGYGRETPGSTFWTRSTGGLYGMGGMEDIVETSYAKQTALGLIPGSRQWTSHMANGGQGRQHFRGLGGAGFHWSPAEHSSGQLSPFIAGLGQDIPADPSALVDTSTWSGDLLNIVKQALPIYQQQQIFNQQLSIAKASGQPVAVATPQGTVVVPHVSLAKMAMIGGVGIVGLVLLMKVVKK